eukprot:14826465-Alexandrium_andersonii.AAC.1
MPVQPSCLNEKRRRTGEAAQPTGLAAQLHTTSQPALLKPSFYPSWTPSSSNRKGNQNNLASAWGGVLRQHARRSAP